MVGAGPFPTQVPSHTASVSRSAGNLQLAVPQSTGKPVAPEATLRADLVQHFEHVVEALFCEPFGAGGVVEYFDRDPAAVIDFPEGFEDRLEIELAHAG